MDELSTKNPLAEQLPSCVQTEFERAKAVYDSKLPQMQTKIQGLEARYAQVVNDLNRFTRAYEERNGNITFDKERASDGENAHIKLAYRALIEQEKELKIFRYAYDQTGKTLDYMFVEVEKEEGRDGTSTLKKGDCPVRDHGHSEVQQSYQSNVERQQKMQDVLKGMEFAFQNGLIDYELEIHRYYEKKFADVEVKLMRLKEHTEIELRNGEENLARFETVSLLLFILLSTTTFYISLNQLVTLVKG